MGDAEKLRIVLEEYINAWTVNAYHGKGYDQVAPVQFSCYKPLAEQHSDDGKYHGNHGDPRYQVDDGSLMA